jgi:putative NIF3 family GTP cyclohydrolase 1 type 2
MNRKDFIRLTALAGSVYATSGIIKGSEILGPESAKDITAADIQEFLVSLVKLPAKTVDRFIIGDPNIKVTKIGTCWMPYWETCKKAVESDVNLLVVHEPTFYTHWDLDEKEGDYYNAPEYTKKQYLDLVEEKKKWILDHGLVIIRNHDTLDALKERGIPFALGQFLGYSNDDIIRSRTYYNVYRIEKQPATKVAASIANKLKELGQPGVAFYGDPDRPVSSVGVGTGCICDPMDFADLNPDLFIAIDDVVRTWTQTTFATDSGRPLIVINHGTSEEMGMRMLNRIIKERFPDIETIHFNEGCSYKWITG